MNHGQHDIRESYGRQHLPRLFRERADETQSDDTQGEIRERYLGVGMAVGCGLGVAIGAGFGVAFGTLASAVGFGTSIGVALGLAIGSTLGDRHARTLQRPAKKDRSNF